MGYRQAGGVEQILCMGDVGSVGYWARWIERVGFDRMGAGPEYFGAVQV